MSRSRWSVLGLLVAAAVGYLVLAKPTTLGDDSSSLASRRGDPLPPGARPVIESLMKDHGENMDALLEDCLLLDYPAVMAHVEEALEVPTIRPPSTPDAGLLNSGLPQEFFDLQSRLREGLATISSAAKAESPGALSRAMGEQIQVCVSCHALYLELP